MYGNYVTTNSAGDEPECSTYPRSGGRTGGSIFNKKWGQRISKCKPIPMTWDDDDDDDDDHNSNRDSLQPVNNWEELRTNLVQNIENNAENEDEKCNQDELQDDSTDAAYEISYDQQDSIISHAGSLYDQRHRCVDNTYPAAKSIGGGIRHPFSTYAVQQQKEMYEATPLRDNIRNTHNFPKTEGKQCRENWVDGFLAKTPHFEMRSAENNSAIFGDSGISSSTKHTSMRNFSDEDGNQSTSKNPSRSLFTPMPRKMQHTAHEFLNNSLNNKLIGVEEIELKSTKDAIPSVLYNAISVRQQLQNDATPMRGLTEKADYIQLVKSLKSEKKTTVNKSHLTGFFTEENKENISHVQTMATSPSGKDREQKMHISKSHSSLLRDDDGCFITPSKEERSLSHANSKSLTNLSHANPPIFQNLHNSRIPTPIRTRTPLKQHSQESIGAGGTQIKTSEADILTKFSQSPPKKDATLGNQPPSSHLPLFSTCHKEASLQFGSAPVIHSMLPSTQVKTSQAVMPPLHSPAINSQNNGGSSKNSDMGSFHGLLGQSGGISNTNKNYLSQFISNFQPSNHSGHQNMMPGVGGKDSSAVKNPRNGHDTAVIGDTDEQQRVGNSQDSNGLLAPVSFAQPAVASHVPNTSSKTFTLRPPVFQAVSQKSDAVHDSKVTYTTTSISSFQTNLGPNQLTCSQNIETSHKTSHLHPSGPLSQPQNSVMKSAPLFQTTSMCNKNFLYTGSGNQEVERNQCFKSVSQPQVNHQPSENLFATAKTQYDSMNCLQGNASYTQVNGNVHPLSNPAISNHALGNSAISCQANIQTVNPPNSNQPSQNFAVPAAKVNTQPQRRETVSAAARPVSSSNRQLLIVNNRRYEVLRLLGKGASSKVYDALDCQTNRCVAVKRVILRQGDALVDGYLKEVELLNQLQGSDCIIKLLDSQVCIEKGYKVLIMVMERGEMDLSTSIKLMSASKSQSTSGSALTGSKIPIVTVIFYWVSMLNAVDEIHRKGIFHSDLKPANFLLVGGQLKLIDFGIATAVQTDVTSVIKEDPAGTPNYMSPEAIGLTVCGSPSTEDSFQNPKASYKSDVWSLGCILYSLIYGCSPFQHITNERIKLDAIRNTNFAIPYPSNFAVHPPLLKALKRCLVREYKQRASIAELKSIDYLGGNDVDKQTWEAWREEKIKFAENRLSACSPESQRIAMKVIQEVLQSPPKKKEQ